MSVTSHLVFDPASLSESANVGAHVRAGTDGTLIGSKNIASADWLNTAAALHAGDGTALTQTGGALDVNISSPLAIDVNLTQADEVTVFQGTSPWVVSATNLDIRDLAFATDSVDVSGSSVTVSATDLDIRDLAFATDSVDVSGSSVTVSATDLDIRDLAAASDSVAAWLNDGSGNAITSSGGALDVNIQSSDISITTTDSALANTAVAAAAASIGTSEGNVVASPLSNRKYLYLFNNGNKGMYLGPTGVTSSSGYPMYPGQAYEFRAGAAVALKAISTAAAQDLRALELS